MATKTDFAEDEAFLIHNAIHSGASTVDLGHGEVYPITISSNKCRRVDARGWTFMEQNRKKQSKTAARARAGDRLTWVMKAGTFSGAMGTWSLIDGDTIAKNPLKAIREGEFVGVGNDALSAVKIEHSGNSAPNAVASYASDAPAAAIARPVPSRYNKRDVGDEAARPTLDGYTIVAVADAPPPAPPLQPAAPSVFVPAAAAAAAAGGELQKVRRQRATVAFDVPAGKRDAEQVNLELPAAARQHRREEAERETVVALNHYREGDEQERLESPVEFTEYIPGTTICYIPYADLVFRDVLGEGASGAVHIAVIREGSRTRFRGMTVAVKVLRRQRPSARERDQFLAEIDLLSKLHHRNIVEFLGACFDPLCLVTAYYRNGSLHQFLHARLPRPNLSLEQKLRLCLETCLGLQYLHALTPRLMHRDLKPANILLDDGLHLRLADFGLTRDVHASVTMTGAIGTPHYMAPEIIEEHRYTEKADIYSIGVIFWEILSGRVPYAGLNPIQIAMRVSSKQLRPEMPAHTPEPIAALIHRCWATEPAQRPRCSEVTAELIRIGRELGLDIEALTLTPPPTAVGSSSADGVQATVLVSATVPALPATELTREPSVTLAYLAPTVNQEQQQQQQPEQQQPLQSQQPQYQLPAQPHQRQSSRSPVVRVPTVSPKLRSSPTDQQSVVARRTRSHSAVEHDESLVAKRTH